MTASAKGIIYIYAVNLIPKPIARKKPEKNTFFLGKKSFLIKIIRKYNDNKIKILLKLSANTVPNSEIFPGPVKLIKATAPARNIFNF